jgi:hypothetical protein
MVISARNVYKFKKNAFHFSQLDALNFTTF